MVIVQKFQPGDSRLAIKKFLREHAKLHEVLLHSPGGLGWAGMSVSLYHHRLDLWGHVVFASRAEWKWGQIRQVLFILWNQLVFDSPRTKPKREEPGQVVVAHTLQNFNQMLTWVSTIITLTICWLDKHSSLAFYYIFKLLPALWLYDWSTISYGSLDYN